MFIQKLGLRNFKCFKEVEVDFSKITLLTGENSAGKSSLVYGILSPLQSIDFNGDMFPFHLSFNGKYVNMGGFKEVSFEHNIKNPIDIHLIFNNNSNDNISLETSWYFDSQNKMPHLNSLKMNIGYDNIEINRYENGYVMNGELQLYGGDNHKIEGITFNNIDEVDGLIRYSTPHLNQGSIYEINYNISVILFEYFYNDLEIENCFNFISSFRFQPDRTYYQSLTSKKVDKFGNGYIDQILKWNDTQSEELIQLVAILKDSGMVYDIKPYRISGGRFEIKVKVKKQSKWESLADVGFGTSQFMPIIVADLQLSDGSTLIMCQPEIHLHPSVQASLGDYLVKQVNEKKKQYIVETHSEYLLNRIRLLIVKGEVEPEDIAVYYFENSIKEGSIAHRIEFTKDGQILNAPRGFFETYMIDTMDIALNA